MNGRTITTCVLALGLLAVSGRVAPAQGWQNNNNEQWDRQHPRFSDQDRQVTREWYQEHRSRLGAGWRQRDRLPPYMEGRLRRGQRLDPRLRREMHWLPSDLARRYGPAPRGYRYAIIGGNIVLLDDWYQVHDVFRLDFSMR
jgi:Ni/Co efflux regulator RcnB